MTFSNNKYSDIKAISNIKREKPFALLSDEERWKQLYDEADLGDEYILQQAFTAINVVELEPNVLDIFKWEEYFRTINSEDK